MCIHVYPLCFPAHIRENGEIQTVEEHCRETGETAFAALSGLGLGNTARLAGLLHDMGKMSEAFAEYIFAAAEGKPVQRGSVNHTFAGAKYALDSFHGTEGIISISDLTSELVAYAVGAHHGLFDAVKEDGGSGFEHRKSYNNEDYGEVLQNYLDQCVSQEELRRLFEAAVHEIEFYIERIESIPITMDNNAANQEMMFYIGMSARLLTSAVMEGDRRSTAVFMGTRSAEQLPGDRREFWRMELENLEKQLGTMPSDTQVNLARRKISDACRAFADNSPGLYRLNVPTGGGKTLAGLRYAFAHAWRWDKKRVFYVAPLISILEQNVDVIRKAAGNPDFVLEHHSNVLRDTTDMEELHRLELLEECWDAPIIVTTLAQFLNSLFSGKSSCVRRFHTLTNSVIIIDEVQTVPANMLSLFNLALNFLAGIGSSTVLLCSATQPRLEDVSHALRVSEMTPVAYDPVLWQVFKRTNIQFVGSMCLEDISVLAKQEIKKTGALLIVCNKKSQAEMLFQRLQSDTVNCFHLSASMCMEHRRRTLNNLFASIEQSRKGGPKTVCISTQVIEAGVDISFDEVVRLCAGMDSIIQTAGRCNRNGESPFTAPVLLVNCENERLSGLEAIQRGKKATNALLYAFKQCPERFDMDLASFESIDYFYQSLYEDIVSDGTNLMDYPVAELRTSMLDLLTFNTKFILENSTGYQQYMLRQAFKTAGSFFNVFDGDTVDVIVPWKAGKSIIDQFMRLDVRWQLKEIGVLLKKAKAYTVSLYDWQIKKLSNMGALYELCDGEILALADGYYNDDTGLMTDRMINGFLEV